VNDRPGFGARRIPVTARARVVGNEPAPREAAGLGYDALLIFSFGIVAVVGVRIIRFEIEAETVMRGAK
jgi:hypothetical protein